MKMLKKNSMNKKMTMATTGHNSGIMSKRKTHPQIAIPLVLRCQPVEAVERVQKRSRPMGEHTLGLPRLMHLGARQFSIDL